MAGHSKWSNIKHKKAATDAKRSKLFSKLIREITVTARDGGGDLSMNPRLRIVVEKSKRSNMPQDTIARAIKRGTGDITGVNYEAQLYEGYGPAGIAIIIEVLTDNKNRVIADLRNLFSKRGGAVAETGSVKWMFEHLGVVHGSSRSLSEEDLIEALIEYDIKNIEKDGENWIISSDLKSLEDIKKCLLELDFSIESAEPEWLAKDLVEVPQEKEKQAIDFLEALEDQDDVQNVYTNLA